MEFKKTNRLANHSARIVVLALVLIATLQSQRKVEPVTEPKTAPTASVKAAPMAPEMQQNPDGGHFYLDQSSRWSVIFSRKPRVNPPGCGMRRGGFVTDRNGFYVAIHKTERPLEEEWRSRNDYRSHSAWMPKVYRLEQTKVDGRPCVRETGSMTTNSGMLFLQERVIFVKEGVRYSLISNLGGDDLETLEAQSKAFWSTFRLYESSDSLMKSAKNLENVHESIGF